MTHVLCLQIHLPTVYGGTQQVDPRVEQVEATGLQPGDQRLSLSLLTKQPDRHTHDAHAMIRVAMTPTTTQAQTT